MQAFISDYGINWKKSEQVEMVVLPSLGAGGRTFESFRSDQ